MFVQKLLVVLALSAGICAGETATAKAPEPETIGAYFYLDAASQTLKRLPKEEWKRHHGTGFSTFTDNIKVEGAESSFHISENKPTFVFKVFKDEDAGKTKLFRFEAKGGGREYELAKWKRKDVTYNEGVTLNVSKFGTSSYAITPESPLEPGEYAIAAGSLVVTFAVGAGK